MLQFARTLNKLYSKSTLLNIEPTKVNISNTIEYTLSMTFVNAGRYKVVIGVSYVKPAITAAETSTLMNTIIAKDVFTSKGGALTNKYGAQLTERKVTKFEHV